MHSYIPTVSVLFAPHPTPLHAQGKGGGERATGGVEGKPTEGMRGERATGRVDGIRGGRKYAGDGSQGGKAPGRLLVVGNICLRYLCRQLLHFPFYLPICFFVCLPISYLVCFFVSFVFCLL